MILRFHALAIAALLLAPALGARGEEAEPGEPSEPVEPKEEAATPPPTPPPAQQDDEIPALQLGDTPAPPRRAAPEAASGLLPPPGLGKTRFAVAGCLAGSDQKRAPVKSAPGEGDEDAKVVKAPGGALVTHPFSHSCCLKAEVSARIEGSHAIVLEKLTGKPCRCMCSSTLRTAVGLTPGWWTVVIDLDLGGKVKRVTTQMVNVPEK